jgi:hypothetical protein
MTPEEFHKRYGYWPSKELQEAWESGPSMTKSRFDDKPIRGLIFNALTDAGMTTEGRAQEDVDVHPQYSRMAGLERWTDPRMLVRGISDVVAKSVDPEDSPGKMDWAMGLLDTVGLGGPKLLGSAVKNVRNYVRGFYGPGGNQAASAASNVSRVPVDIARQVVSPARTARASQGLSSATYDVLRDNVKIYDDLATEWKTASPARREEIARERRDMGRQMAGQLNQNVIHNQMRGTPNKALQDWYKTHFKNVTTFDRTNSAQIFDDVDSDLIFDMSQSAWGPMKSSTGGVAYAEKVGTKGAGNSHRDIFGSRQYNTLRKLSKYYEDAGQSLRTRDDFIKALDDWDPNWSSMIALNPKNIVDGTNGVLIQFTPTGKSDYLLGGFNAIIKFGDDGTAKFFGTDKQDIFGVGIPGASDAVVGIGSTSRRIGWRGKESRTIPRQYTKPPREAKEGSAVVTQKRTVRTRKGDANRDRGAPTYLSKKERELIDALLALDSSVSPSFLASRGAAAGIPASLLGMDYYE